MSEAKRDRRRSLFVASATRLFAAGSANSVGMDEIGAAAGLNGPTIYRYFSSKMDLVDVVVASAVMRLAGLLTNDRDFTGLTPEQKLVAAVQKLVKVVLANGDRSVIVMQQRKHCSDGAYTKVSWLWNSVIDFHARLITAWRPDMGRPEAEARFSLVFASLAALVLRDLRVPRKRAEELLVKSVLAVLSERPGLPLKRKSTVWQLAPNRQEAILQAAIRLIAESGYEGVRIEEIGAAAGVTAAGVYSYYGSKADILVDILERSNAMWVSNLTEAIDMANSASDALERFAGSVVRIAARNPAAIAVSRRNWHVLPRADFDRLMRSYNRLIDIWARVLLEVRAGLNAREVNLVVTGGLELGAAAGTYSIWDYSELLMAWYLGRPANAGSPRLTSIL